MHARETTTNNRNRFPQSDLLLLRLRDVMERVARANDERSRLIHDTWAVGAERTQLMRSMKSTHRLVTHQVSLQRLVDANIEVGSCSMAEWS